ncbi:tRNA (guanine-N2)-dimethyltransferase [Candidatus Aerophobetes bacterium]|uniref:tRNA (Guanine-N2)-dimethyltransferase n=1 Tax=Aerophobetes bacterium TaxID=2030807 RepID=A0A2A4X7F3_UNCAE|nr:MAG: tRNA (guanine-N2)-dimethyltransferase [Candidatus Aerophobetes bacterium]
MVLVEFSERKFLSLSAKQQHKIAASVLSFYHTSGKILYLQRYNAIAKLLNLYPMDQDFESRSNRYHHHLNRANISPPENMFLTKNISDKLSNHPFIGIDTYLCNLRSAHNVGSIIRTVEAFRLGSIFFSPTTPTIENSKVQKTSMGTYPLVSTQVVDPDTLINTYKKPLIALEIRSDAKPLYSFTFPKECILIVGNEEYGISENLLEKAQSVIKIPLAGGKHSLNVANAFACVAYEIARQRAAAMSPAE